MDGGKCCVNSFSPEIQWTPESERSSTLTSYFRGSAAQLKAMQLSPQSS
jgi:hypothetical protein